MHLVLGSFRVYQTTDRGATWQTISPQIAARTSNITAIVIAPSQGSVIYAGTSTGRLFVAPPQPDATTPWIERDQGLPVGSGNAIMDLAIDPHDPNHLFLVTQNTATLQSSVWTTQDGGVSWTNLTGDLPPAYQLYTIAPDWRFSAPVLYVGTTKGVFASADLGVNWRRFGVGLPNTEVRDLELLPQSGVLTAGTYGRSAWQIEIPGPQFIATGAGAGGGPQVNVYDAQTGALQFQFFAYDQGFTGGVRVRVALGDVNGGGVPDIITAPGQGGGPNVKVFDGRNASLLFSFFAYDQNFTGGVYVAAADFNGDGKADVVTGAGPGGGPNVKVFSGMDTTVLFSFFAYDHGFTGGVRVAAGDVNQDGTPDVVAAAGPGGGPNIRVFSGQDMTLVQSFFAYDPGFLGGVYVGVGDSNNDGFADIITGAGAGGGPNVKVFRGQDDATLQSFFAFDPAFLGGVTVAARNGNGTGTADLIAGAGPGGGPNVRVFAEGTSTLLDDFFAYDSLFRGGVFVG